MNESDNHHGDELCGTESHAGARRGANDRTVEDAAGKCIPPGMPSFTQGPPQGYGQSQFNKLRIVIVGGEGGINVGIASREDPEDKALGCEELSETEHCHCRGEDEEGAQDVAAGRAGSRSGLGEEECAGQSSPTQDRGARFNA